MKSAADKPALHHTGHRGLTVKPVFLRSGDCIALGIEGLGTQHQLLTDPHTRSHVRVEPSI